MRVFVYGRPEFLPIGALAQGIEAAGDRVIWRSANGYKYDCYEPCDVAVIFGMREPMPLILEHQRAHGTPVIVVDLGYVKRGNQPATRQNPAGVYWSVGLNGLNGHADFHNQNSPAARWETLGVELQPWREAGEHILVCGQKPFDAAMQHLEPRVWAEQTIEAIRGATDRPIRFRPHPEDAGHRKIARVEYSQNANLIDDLRGCWATVAYNSNSLVESVIAGVPAFALGAGSMVEGVCNFNLSQLDEPAMPDREQWAHGLAYAQWTIVEMAEGKPWRHLLYGDTPATQPTVESPGVYIAPKPTQDRPHRGRGSGRAARARASSGDTGEHALSAGG